ncbi:MAG: DUF58 domain-containing protein [Spirochaetales bacterium]|uniref:DUF58 domain-containing protein n=1 Tax=Candidatus Thalassospirochaeta sargassi TaxID=3119039 RepID=A0AAJ1IBN0_9SPIO|nr:DUF58 domain-containing protein [Spirochaetales bacterium]
MDSLQLLSRIRNIPLVSARLVEGFLSGNYRSVFKGPGLEFDEVREYSTGDDVRSIDWNVTSRMGSPYVKTFREEREMALLLLIDVSASLQTGSGTYRKADTAAIISALLAHSAVHNNDRVGAVFYTDRIEKWVPPMKGRNHLMRLVQDMASIEPVGKGSDLSNAIACVEQSMKRRGICIIVSDFRIPPAYRQMSMLSRKHDLIAVKITDPADKKTPSTGLMELQDPESGRISGSYGFSSRYRKDLEEFWLAEHIFWQRECRRRGIDSLVIDTEEDPAKALLSFFRRRKGK